MRPQDCPKLKVCPKVEMILDKDLLGFQYAEAIESVCSRCTEVVGQQVRRPSSCQKCGQVMILASMYDPDALIPLHGGITDLAGVPVLVCINQACEDGSRNTREEAHA